MFLHQEQTEGLSINSYIIGDLKTKKCAIIDPTRETHRYIEIAQKNHLSIEAILETHIHADFVSGAKQLKYELKGKPQIYCSGLGGSDWIPKYADIVVRENQEIKAMSNEVEEIASKNEDVKLLQTIDGVGPITALAFKAEVDDAKRFENSKDVAAYIGLTPKQYSSGEVHRQGGISKKGSKRTRDLLVEAASALLTRCKAWSKLKAWGLKLLKKKGNRKAVVAVARKLAVIMHKMLLTKKPFERGSPKQEKVAA